MSRMSPTFIPPRSSRNRMVLKLQEPIALFQMTHEAPSLRPDVQSFLLETISAKPQMYVNSIMTSIVRQAFDPGYKEVLVDFYGHCGTQEIEASASGQERKRIFLVLPQDWTSRMYLGALNLLIRKYGVLSVEDYILNAQSYATINELQNLFAISHLQSSLNRSAAFLDVNGGTAR